MRVKKIESIVDNLTVSEEKRRKLILQIQELHRKGASISEIAGITGKARGTVRKYLSGNAELLCRSNKQGNLDGYKDIIIKSIRNGMTQSSIARHLKESGYTGTSSNARQYICRVAAQYGLEISRYRNTKNRPDDAVEQKPKADYITRKGIFNYLWMDGRLERHHHEFLWEEYPVLQELESCIRQFREIYIKKNMALLYMFIDRYRNSSIKEIASFAKGLEKDIAAVENSVASPLSNGFVEGTNNKLKMIKRTMYGRCGKKLLEAKLMYQPNARTDNCG